MRDTPHRLMAIAESRAEMADARIGELESERDSLREACEAAQKWICRVSNQYMFYADDPHDVLAKIRAALEKQ